MATNTEKKSSKRIKSRKIFWAGSLAVLLFLNSAGSGLAQSRLGGLEATKAPIGYKERDIFVIGSGVARTALSFLGVIFVALIIVGGFIWMTAQGNAAKTKTAGKLIVAAVIGLIIIVASYTISSWVADTFSPPVLQTTAP